MTYDPQINDYVKWNNHEGWVYFKGDEYITIEIGTNPKSDDLVPMHKKHHILLVCYNHLWHELEYVKKENPNTIPLELIPILLSLLFAKT